MSLSVIIPTHNRPENLLRLTTTLVELSTDFPLEIIVVNDDLSQDLSDILPEKVIYIENPKGGVAASRNIGAEKASYSNLLFIDDDMLVNAEAVFFAESFLNENEEHIVNVNWVYPDALLEKCVRTKFGRYLIKSGHTTLKGWMNNTDWYPDKVYEVNGIGSAFMGIRSEDFRKTGGYNEQFPYAGFEDHEFGERVRHAGLKVILNTHITIHHNEAENIYIANWLQRKYRNYFTRGIGVAALNLGDMQLSYPRSKKLFYRLIFSARIVFRFLLYLIPNTRKMDRLYYFCFEKLYGAHLYAGYTAGLNSINQVDKK